MWKIYRANYQFNTKLRCNETHKNDGKVICFLFFSESNRYIGYSNKFLGIVLQGIPKYKHYEKAIKPITYRFLTISGIGIWGVSQYHSTVSVVYGG